MRILHNSIITWTIHDDDHMMLNIRFDYFASKMNLSSASHLRRLGVEPTLFQSSRKIWLSSVSCDNYPILVNYRSHRRYLKGVLF